MLMKMSIILYHKNRNIGIDVRNERGNIEMIEHPIIALRLQGYDEHICIDISEVHGFPNEISYGGGYFAQGNLDIRVGSYSVCAKHSFTTGELYDFLCQLQKCYDAISGEAVLENAGYELELKLTFQKTGKVLATGMFQERPDVDTRLYFEMMTDQSAVADALCELKNVYSIFGDKKGIIKT